MNLSLYDIIYIVTSPFGTYIIYKFMAVFFDRKDVNPEIEMYSYLGYNIAICIIYLVVKIPIVMMLSNIVLFFLLTLNYESNLKERTLAVFLIYLILFCTEMCIVFLTGHPRFPIFTKDDYHSIFGVISVKIVSYIAALVICNYKNIRSGGIVPNSYWFCIFLIPTATLYIMVTIFMTKDLPPASIATTVVLILLINFSTFYLYDNISKVLSDKLDKTIISQQNIYYERQLTLMQSSLKATRTIRHDLKNHLSAIYSLAREDKKDELLEHISSIIRTYVDQREYSNSGNIVVDSILNYKLQEAEQNHIKVSLDITIPNEIIIPSYDMTIILGNLLDNAINAVCKLKHNRYIDIMIKYTKGRLVINIENSFDGLVLTRGNTLLSTNEDKENHGIGLESVKMILQKYNGSIDIGHDENIFSVTLLMYID